MICIMREKGVCYPPQRTVFRPSESYPEYMFDDLETGSFNMVYKMIRDGFIKMGLDIDNIGSSLWNPFKDYVKPGYTVLLKPNMVLDYNLSGGGTDCLFTHPSIVAAVMDYVCIALKGKGKIIIGDAPLQECNFDALCKESGYQCLVDYYKGKGIDVELVDFRNVKTIEKNGLRYLREEKKEEGVTVHLDGLSAHNGLSQKRLKNLRITNYDPRILQMHHHDKKHEYKVSKYVLDADVIFNLPKPKTHRKAGVTIALKNLVGINANKEYLPHHTLGSVNEGGDAYKTENVYLNLANMVLDVKNILEFEKNMELADKAKFLYDELHSVGQRLVKEDYWEGSWYGNDTIWRTILDLNRILLYADKHGKIKDSQQRKVFIVADMIVSGQKEGPLAPSPLYAGMIAMGDDSLCFDRVVCSAMGFDYRDIPSLSDYMVSDKYPISTNEEPVIVSNYTDWDGASCKELKNKSLMFQPTRGWEEKIGNPYKEYLIKDLQEIRNPIYIFGAGMKGKTAYKLFKRNGIEICSFCDNNNKLHNTDVLDGIKCINLENTDLNGVFIISVPEAYAEEVKAQILSSGRTVKGIYP